MTHFIYAATFFQSQSPEQENKTRRGRLDVNHCVPIGDLLWEAWLTSQYRALPSQAESRYKYVQLSVNSPAIKKNDTYFRLSWAGGNKIETR